LQPLVRRRGRRDRAAYSTIPTATSGSQPKKHIQLIHIGQIGVVDLAGRMPSTIDARHSGRGLAMSGKRPATGALRDGYRQIDADRALNPGISVGAGRRSPSARHWHMAAWYIFGERVALSLPKSTSVLVRAFRV
jgi:hypothetical protein